MTYFPNSSSNPVAQRMQALVQNGYDHKYRMAAPVVQNEAQLAEEVRQKVPMGNLTRPTPPPKPAHLSTKPTPPPKPAVLVNKPVSYDVDLADAAKQASKKKNWIQRLISFVVSCVRGGWNGVKSAGSWTWLQVSKPFSGSDKIAGAAAVSAETPQSSAEKIASLKKITDEASAFFEANPASLSEQGLFRVPGSASKVEALVNCAKGNGDVVANANALDYCTALSRLARDCHEAYILDELSEKELAELTEVGEKINDLLKSISSQWAQNQMKPHVVSGSTPFTVRLLNLLGFDDFGFESVGDQSEYNNEAEYARAMGSLAGRRMAVQGAENMIRMAASAA